MAAPNISPRLGLPNESDIPITYSELMEQISCLCSGGAVIKPGSLPSATINLGDIVVDHSKLLAAFTSIYSMIAVILKTIACIIDVLCALPSPIATIKAIIRLFGTCLPDLILLFPQFAIPAIIICIIKIILAIIEYITEVIIPITQDIIANLKAIKDAFNTGNQDSVAAISFKLASLFKEIFNIFGILDALAPILDVIKALLNLKIKLPCRGGGGSCDGCGDDQCPSLLQESEVTGTDGILSVIYNGDGIEDYEIYFTSPSRVLDFISIMDFFPKSIDYNNITDLEEVPYSITVGGNSYIAKYVDGSGNMNLQHTKPTLMDDGYLNSVEPGGGSFSNPKYYHFGTDTETFTPAMINDYIVLNDGSNSINSGTWRIANIYDGYNISVEHTIDNAWVSSNDVYWRLPNTAPSSAINQTYTLEINHNELIRADMIGLGCHPAVKLEVDGLAERYPELDNDLDELPDVDQFKDDLINAVPVPTNVDQQYILDNYDTINVDNMLSDLNGVLDSFNSDIITYHQGIYGQVFDPEKTALAFLAVPDIQIVGTDVSISLTIYDRSGGILGKGLFDQIYDVKIVSNSGAISSTEPILDSDGKLTGTYVATLTSSDEELIDITATVGGIDVAEYINNIMEPKVLQVRFVSSREDAIDKASSEPVGKA